MPSTDFVILTSAHSPARQSKWIYQHQKWEQTISEGSEQKNSRVYQGALKEWWVFPKALPQLVLQFWLEQQLWILLHSVFLPLMQMYFWAPSSPLKKEAPIFSEGTYILLNSLVVVLANSLDMPFRPSSPFSSWQSMLSSFPRRQLYQEETRWRSSGSREWREGSCPSRMTIFESSFEQEYFSSSSFLFLMSERRLQRTFLRDLCFSSTIMLCSLGLMGSRLGRGVIVWGPEGAEFISLQRLEGRPCSRLLGSSIVLVLVRGVWQLGLERRKLIIKLSLPKLISTGRLPSQYRKYQMWRIVGSRVAQGALLSSFLNRKTRCEGTAERERAGGDRDGRQRSREMQVGERISPLRVGVVFIRRYFRSIIRMSFKVWLSFLWENSVYLLSLAFLLLA